MNLNTHKTYVFIQYFEIWFKIFTANSIMLLDFLDYACYALSFV